MEFLRFLLVSRRLDSNLEPGQNVSLWRLLNRDRPWCQCQTVSLMHRSTYALVAFLFDLRPGLGAVSLAGAQMWTA